MQPRAVAILAIVVARLPERRDRLLALAARIVDLAEREPRRGKMRREFHRLRHHVGRRVEIAALAVLLRELVAPVGGHVSGGDKERLHARLGSDCLSATDTFWPDVHQARSQP